MKKIVLALVLIITSTSLFAEELVKFSLENRRAVGDVFFVDIMAEPVAGNWLVGSCNFIVEFNEEALSLHGLENAELINQGLISSKEGYKIDQTEYNSNMVSLNIFNMTPVKYYQTKEILGTIKFNIKNRTEFDNLKFVPKDTEVFDNWTLLEYNISTSAGYKIVNPEPKRINEYTGIKTGLNSELMKISPNPANKEISVNINETKAQNTEISVYNEAGQIVYNTKNVMSENIKINSKDFASGIYIIVLKYDNKIIQNKIIVKH